MSKKEELVIQAFKDFACALFKKPKFEQITDQRGLSIALARFYVEEIHNALFPGIDEQEIDEAVVDGSKDLGIDLISRDNGNVLIVQAKNTKQVGDKDVQHFRTLLKRIESGEFNSHRHLAEIIKDIDFVHDTFHLVFVARGTFQPAALSEKNLAPELPAISDLGERVHYDWLDLAELADNYEKARSTEAEPKYDFTFDVAGKRGNKSPIIEPDSTPRDTAVFCVSAEIIYRLYEAAGKEALFSHNIRGYLGDTKTNAAISKTLLSEEDKNFFFYNNGISCTCTKLEVDQDNGKVKTWGIQVINGAQTVRSIHHAGGKPSSTRLHHQNALVLVRVTEIDKGYAGGGDFREKIVKYNNTQNQIKTSDFRSNDPVQRDLAYRFSHLRVTGTHKKVEYSPKRQPGGRERIRIRMEEFAKVTYSFLFDPTDFSGDSNFLFDKEPKKGYCKVFGDGEVPWSEIPSEEFQAYAGIWWLADALRTRAAEVREEYKKKAETSKDSDEKKEADLEYQALERRWLVIFAMKCVLRRSFKDDIDKVKSVVAKFAEKDFVVGENKRGKWVADLLDKSINLLVTSYLQAASEEKPFDHRNWTRSSRSSTRIWNFSRGFTVGDLE